MNNNGDLSFNVSWTTWSPTAFPIPTYPVVAIYQADVYTVYNGSVWYRITQNATLLAKAANDIRALTGTSVSLQWLFIATWDHVGYCCSGTDKVVLNTITLFINVWTKVSFMQIYMFFKVMQNYSA